MQTFCTNAQLSGPHVVDCSVAQGSVISTLKFNGYTEDLDDLLN